MRIDDRRSPLSPVKKGMNHSADDRTRPDNRHLDDDVIETFGGMTGKRRHLRPALYLKNTDSIGLIQHFEDLRVILWQMRQINRHRLVPLDHRYRFFQSRKHS